MTLKHELLVRQFCDLWGDGTPDSRPDVEKIVNMMSQEAVWQLWVPGGPVIKGRDALRQEIRRQMEYATQNKCNIINIASSDSIVMTERSDYAVIRGIPMPHSMVAVYEFDDDDLISAWREYLDTADLAKKSGVDPAARASENSYS